MHDEVRCRCLFATHYHELTRLAERLDCLSLHHVRAREWKGDLVLLHEVADGAADRSYGIAVAKLAGLPPAGRRPRQLGARQARSGPRRDRRDRRRASTICRCSPRAAEPEPAPDPVAAALAEVEPDSLTPARGAGNALPAEAAAAERAMSLFDVENRRAIIDRRAIAERLAALRPGKKRTAKRRDPARGARAAAAPRSPGAWPKSPGSGRAAAQATPSSPTRSSASLTIIVTERVLGEPTGGEAALVGVGGNGRGEMALHSATSTSCS